MSQFASSLRPRRFARKPGAAGDRQINAGNDAVAAAGDGNVNAADHRAPGEAILPGEPKPPEHPDTSATVPRTSMSATVLAMLVRGEGASLDELVVATGWLPHTTRAALTGLRKKGHAITREKIDGVTRYIIRSEMAE